MASVTKACCEIPPVITSGYEEKGKYITVGGAKTYVTGPSDATKGIFLIGDVFGFFAQSLQGADILSTSDEKNKYQVFFPDFFNGNFLPLSTMPPDTPEKQKMVSDFFSGPAAAPAAVERADKMMEILKTEYGHITKWAILGFCWGGKISSLIIKTPSPFSAMAEAHPAMIDPADATGIKIPLCMLASKDEDAGAVEKFRQNLTGPKHIEIFKDQVHGWMTARSNLDDPHVKSEYERGYKTVLEFYAQYV